MTTPSTPPSAPSPGRVVVLPIPDGPRVVVVVAGEVDLSNAALMRDRLIKSLVYGPNSAVVDATDLTFCDLHGLDALTEAVEAVEHSGVSVTVRPSPQLARLAATVLPPSRSAHSWVDTGPAVRSGVPRRTA